MSVSEQDKATLNAEVVEALIVDLKKIDFVDYFIEVIQENDGNLLNTADTLEDGYSIDDFVDEFGLEETIANTLIGWLNKAEISIEIAL